MFAWMHSRTLQLANDLNPKKIVSYKLNSVDDQNQLLFTLRLLHLKNGAFALKV